MITLEVCLPLINAEVEFKHAPVWGDSVSYLDDVERELDRAHADAKAWLDAQRQKLAEVRP